MPATVSSARIWPSPGVSISSRSAETGSSPAISGRPRTRERQASWWPRPISPVPTASIAGRGEHRPARAVEVAAEDVEAVDRPLADRAERSGGDADPAVDHAARRPPRARGRAAGPRRPRSPLIASARSGVKSATRSTTVPSPSTYDATVGRAARSRTARAASRAAPTRRCRGARSGARRRPSRSRCGAGRARPSGRRARAGRARRCGKSGTVISEPLDAIGLAPITRKYDVRSMSGIGRKSWWPNIRCATSWWGSWSTDVARKRLRVRKDLTIAVPWVSEPRLCALGLPR